MLNEVIADVVPGTRSAAEKCIVNTRRSEHRSDAAIRGYNFIKHALKKRGISISMDGKGRWRDNVYIERFWRSIKYECIFLKEYSTLPALENGLQRWIKRYNTWRPHQALENKTPQEFYQEGLCNIAPKILVAPLQVVEASSLRSENLSNLAVHTQNLELTSRSTPSSIPNQY